MDFDKDIKTECFDSTVVVCDKPCWLFSIIGISAQSTSKVLTVRDGVLLAAPVKMILYCSLYNNPVIIFNYPVYFKNGLYLQFATTMAVAIVQYKNEY